MTSRGLQRAATILFLALGTGFLGTVWAERTAVTVLPFVPEKTLSLFDTRPIAVTVTAFWQKAPRIVTVDQLLRDHTLWRQMHIGDWDKVPSPLRERALGTMLDHYRHLLTGPGSWASLSVFDWDLVPQPVRALAFQRMVEHWTSYYDVGSGYAENPEIVADTVSALIMAESWFEHRAIHVNQWANRDLGLAGCSNHCRNVLEETAGERRLDFLLDDHEYFDPWNGTRVAAVWFGRELARAEGNMDLAIAAYHRGLDAARRGEGTEYAANVKRLRHRYINGHDAPPAWAFLMREADGSDRATAARPGSPGRTHGPAALSLVQPASTPPGGQR